MSTSNPAGTIRVAVVDDHPLLRDGLCGAFAAQPDFEMVGEGASRDDALRLVAATRPDVILLDINMPGGGITAARSIKEAFPEVKVVILTVSEEDDDVVAAMQCGASGYVLKGISGSSLATIVRQVADGRPYVAPSLAARMLAAAATGKAAGARTQEEGLATLTFREEQILNLLAEGLSNKEIGQRLQLQEKTVKHYVTIIFQKLQVRNRVEAALVAKKARRTLDRALPS